MIDALGRITNAQADPLTTFSLALFFVFQQILSLSLSLSLTLDVSLGVSWMKRRRLFDCRPYWIFRLPSNAYWQQIFVFQLQNYGRPSKMAARIHIFLIFSWLFGAVSVQRLCLFVESDCCCHCCLVLVLLMLLPRLLPERCCLCVAEKKKKKK